MKNKRVIKWSFSAEKDLLDIAGYVSSDSFQRALRIIMKIQSETEKLRDLPEKGRIVPEFEIQAINIFRELILPPWRIVYSFSNESINILAVLDSRRNLEDLILKKVVRAIERS
jgi:toxin ParE1/3/4